MSILPEVPPVILCLNWLRLRVKGTAGALSRGWQDQPNYSPMSLENNSDHRYRFGYAVCAIFLTGFVLVTCAVVSDALHRPELEELVPLAVATPSPTPGP